MKYKSSILVNLPVDDHLALKQLADSKRQTMNGMVRAAILDLLKREGMDPMSKEKTPSQIAG